MKEEESRHLKSKVGGNNCPGWSRFAAYRPVSRPRRVSLSVFVCLSADQGELVKTGRVIMIIFMSNWKFDLAEVSVP